MPTNICCDENKQLIVNLKKNSKFFHISFMSNGERNVKSMEDEKGKLTES